MDAWLIDKTDQAAGRVQERGFPLPLLQREAHLGFFGALVLCIADAWLRLGPNLPNYILIGLLMLMAPAVWQRVKQANRDLDRMDDPDVADLYRRKALTNRVLFVPARIFLTLFTLLPVLGLLVNRELENLLWVAMHLLLLSTYYVDTALPRTPSNRARDPEWRLAPQGSH